MTEYLFTNNAVSSLAADIGGADTVFTVPSGEGDLFPAVSAGGGQGFIVLMTSGSTQEWMTCTARTGDSLTVTRGGSNSFSAGAAVKLVLNATCLGNFIQKGVFREVITDPNGSLEALYGGEEVYNTVTTVWWKHCNGTLWKEIR